MMLNYRKLTGGVLLATLLLVGGLAAAAGTKQPVGRVTIAEKQFGMLLGGSKGSGTLIFKRKKYHFTISGMSAGLNVGASKMSAVGEVYDMKDVSKFAGTYTQLDASVALGGGVGSQQLKNENGVIMALRSRTQGLNLNLGKVSGLKVTLD
jgi:hypothetical protein